MSVAIEAIKEHVALVCGEKNKQVEELLAVAFLPMLEKGLVPRTHGGNGDRALDHLTDCMLRDASRPFYDIFKADDIIAEQTFISLGVDYDKTNGKLFVRFRHRDSTRVLHEHIYETKHQVKE